MKIFITALFLLFSFAATAEENMRYYDVEVIIFENLDPAARQSEVWPLQATIDLPEHTVELGQPVLSDWLPAETDKRFSYKLLPASQFQLNEQLEKLSADENYRVLLHTAWRQPGLSRKLALPVHFKRTIAALPELNTIESNNPDSAYTAASPSATGVPHELEGLLRVTLARYLRLEAELLYHAQATEQQQTDNPFVVLDTDDSQTGLNNKQVIHVKQVRRRIRSNELHYLDHPVLGLLLKITPFKPEESTAAVTIKQ